MGFFAALGSILATADGIAWAFLALAPTLFFLTFLLDGYIGQEGEVHPVANGGFIVSVGASLFALWALLGSFLLAHGLTVAHGIAVLLYAAVFVVLVRLVIKGGSLVGRSLRQRSQR